MATSCLMYYLLRKEEIPKLNYNPFNSSFQPLSGHAAAFGKRLD
jgi:hypothetical protein